MLPRLSTLYDFAPRFYACGPMRFHLPLLSDVVALMRPSRVVTVGFGDGDAHFTFCETVRQQRLACECLALPARPDLATQDDAWQAGVANSVEFYGDIARLISSAPEEAAAALPDASVDLLLVDDSDSAKTVGRALRAFEGKLKPSGCVLIHGIELKRKHGPREIWNAWRRGRAAVEFEPGIGLGIAEVGEGTNPFFTELAKQDSGLPVTKLYHLAATRVEAAATADAAVHRASAFEMRQIWLDTLVDQRWKVQEILDHQARVIAELQSSFEPLRHDREKAQEVMDAQAERLQGFDALLRDRERAQEVMDAQAEDLEAARRDSQQMRELLATQMAQDAELRNEVAELNAQIDAAREESVAELTLLRRQFEELHRDRVKAQLIMDTQLEQLNQLTSTTQAAETAAAKYKRELSEAKRVMKHAKQVCRRGGRCFHLPAPGEQKERKTVGQKVVRELLRLPNSVQRMWTPPPPPAPKQKKAPVAEAPEDRYPAWIAEHEPSAAALQKQRDQWAAATNAPRISLMVPVFNTPANFLEAMFESVLNQTYANWELCVVDGGSEKRETRARLAEWEARAPRIRVRRIEKNLGIAENSNRGLELATGDFVALLDHDDLLAAFALHEIAKTIIATPDVELLYSDEDRWGADGRRHSPFFKPEWSPELLYSCMYFGHLSCYRRSLLEEVGGFRKEFDLSQDYDLALRATERARKICHVPHVLYHWREHPESGSTGGKPDARRTNLAALRDAMRRRNLAADVLELPTANRVRMIISGAPKASIIIPTDSPERAASLVENLSRVTAYGAWEIVMVTNSRVAETLQPPPPGSGSLRVVRYDEPFNFSAKCNAGAELATGERLIFFNDDVEAIEADWIENLIEPLENAEVGAVSPKLLYESGMIQHAGLVTGVRGLIGTAFHQQPADSTMHVNFAQSMRNVSALSGACLAIRRADFLQLGGFDAENTPVSHSDIDLCFKLREAGLRCVYTPFTTLKHLGHLSIGEEEKQKARPRDKSSIYLLKRWGGYATHDPFYPTNMRDWLYADSPTPIRMFGRNDAAAVAASPDLLFVSHDLSLSGAPILLLQLAEWCRRNDIFVTVVAPADGALRRRYEAAGVPLIIDPLVMTGHESFASLLRDFDCVVANTIRSAPVLRVAQAEGAPVLWWLHETMVGEHYLREDAQLRAAISVADMILTPSERTASVYRPFTAHPVRSLPYGIPDVAAVQPVPPRDPQARVRFLLLGTIEPRKGQDVLLDAIRAMPSQVRDAADYQIVGRINDPAFGATIMNAAREVRTLSIGRAVDHEEALELLAATDVLVCASRDEALPVTILEAMSLGKAIVSTKVGGVPEFLTDGVDALLVPSEQPEQLGRAMRRLIEDASLRAQLGANARAHFEQRFTPDVFGAEFKQLIAEVTRRGGVAPPG